MDSDQQNGNGAGPAGDGPAGEGRARERAQATSDSDQTASGRDQTASDSDQTASDSDQTASDRDQEGADGDQRASDRDQATADRERAADPSHTDADESAYDASRAERETGTSARIEARHDRAEMAHHRDLTAAGRDRVAEARDAAGRDRVAEARDAAGRDRVAGARDPRTRDARGRGSAAETALLEQLERLTVEAAADRARAGADRARAAADRADAARQRRRLEAELRLAHLDQLTGAYRREMGRLALSHEIDRARRTDGRFVLAFVDVDDLKTVNDRQGHATGDLVLQTVVRVMRTRLRSFDPIVRYGGDEFLCGIGGTNLVEARHRFDSIAAVIDKEVGVGISVGLASLEGSDGPDDLTIRADEAMLMVKVERHAHRS